MNTNVYKRQPTIEATAVHLMTLNRTRPDATLRHKGRVHESEFNRVSFADADSDHHLLCRHMGALGQALGSRAAALYAGVDGDRDQPVGSGEF